MSDGLTDEDRLRIIEQIATTHKERRTPGAPYVSDRRMLEFCEYHIPWLMEAAKRGVLAQAHERRPVPEAHG